jgi:biopolymer transport protein ExbB
MGPSAHDLLAMGITEALVTTALGLLVAIPSLMFYNYLVGRIELYIREVEYIGNSFIAMRS